MKLPFLQSANLKEAVLEHDKQAVRYRVEGQRVMVEEIIAMVQNRPGMTPDEFLALLHAIRVELG